MIHGSAVSEVKHDITELKEKVIEHKEVCLFFVKSNRDSLYNNEFLVLLYNAL